MSVRRVDVAIVGAGAAGSAAACVLARTASVALIDRVAAPGWRIGETLPGAARRLLVALGAWERFAAAAHGDVPVRISRWGSDEPTEFDGLCDPDGGGWRIDRARFERDLRADAIDAGATLVEAGVDRLQWDGSRWMVPIDRGDAIVADRIVATTGRGGGFSGRIGQRRVVFDRLVCVHQRVAARDANPATYVHAVADGWWYTALLPGGERVVAFHGDADGPAIRRVLREGPARAALATPGLAEAIGARVDTRRRRRGAAPRTVSQPRRQERAGWRRETQSRRSIRYRRKDCSTRSRPDWRREWRRAKRWQGMRAPHGNMPRASGRCGRPIDGIMRSTTASSGAGATGRSGGGG